MICTFVPRCQVQRPDVNDKLKRAELRRKEEEERRRAELEAKQKLKDDRTKAAKMQQQQGAAASAAVGGGGASSAVIPLQPRSGNVAATSTTTAAGSAAAAAVLKKAAPQPHGAAVHTHQAGFSLLGVTVAAAAGSNAPTPHLRAPPAEVAAAAKERPPLTPADMVGNVGDCKSHTMFCCN